jgi:hypothetical protein
MLWIWELLKDLQVNRQRVKNTAFGGLRSKGLNELCASHSVQRYGSRRVAYSRIESAHLPAIH